MLTVKGQRVDAVPGVGSKNRITVIIPTVGRSTLINCLNSILDQTRIPDQILVIDGSRRNLVEELSKEYPRVDVIKQTSQNRSVVEALNLGIANTRGDIAAFIDDDAVAQRDWLMQLVRPYEVEDRVGGVGGFPVITSSEETDLDVQEVLTGFNEATSRIIKVAGAVYSSFFQENLPFLRLSHCGVCVVEPRGVPDTISDVDFMIGCNMSFRMDAIRMIGGFDDGYIEHGECVEVDACVRLKETGFRILLNPKAIVYHSISKENAIRSIRGRSRNLYYFVAKNSRTGLRLGLLKANLYLTARTVFYVAMFLRTRNREYMLGLRGAVEGCKLMLKPPA